MEYEIEVNVAERTMDVPDGTPLPCVLHDELGLMSAKYGCGIVAWGACTVRKLLLVLAAALVPSLGAAQELRKVTAPRFAYPSRDESTGAIVYESAVTGNWEIYRMPAEGMTNDGATVEPLTRSPALDRMPSASPDGRHIAFVSDRDGNYEVYRMDSDGSNVVRLTRTPEAEIHPFWSSDSRTIIYNRRVADERLYAIWTMDADGGNATEVLRDEELNSYARLSPDGRLVVFDKWWKNEETNGEIMILDLASGALTRLTENTVYDGYPAWFPDGRHVLYASEVDGVFKLFRLPVAGGEPEQLTFGPHHDRRATVSADGRRILFNREIDGSVEIWEMPVPPVRRSP
jgi:TolB protein